MQWKVRRFEKMICDRFKTKNTLGISSGTAAIITALKALGIGPGDKVILPASTFVASAGAVVMAGAVPVFAEIDDSLNIDPYDIKRVADKHTKAVMPVPTMGNPCQMDIIVDIANSLGLKVIEDVAQSFGSMYKGKYSGTYGNIGCFSLQMNKTITTGEGGAVITDDDKLYERAVRYHDHGMFREKEGFLSMKEEEDIFIGQNYRMSEFTGAVAIEQLKKLELIINSFKNISRYIEKNISDIKGITLRRINDPDGYTGNAVMFTLKTRDLAKEFRHALNAENISAQAFYGGRTVYMMPQILNKMTADKSGFPFNHFENEIKYYEGLCPVSEDLLSRNVTIKISPLYSKKDSEDIVEGIRKVAQRLL